MSKLMLGALFAVTLLTLGAEAQQPKQAAPPQKAAEGEKTNPRLWYRLLFQSARADLFTHWERVHPHRTLSAAKTPRVYKRNTQSIDAVTYELEGQRYPLSHYIEKADVSGLMHTPGHEPKLTKKGNVGEGYSFQFWLPLDYDEEFMALGAFGQYLWIDRKRDFVVAQFSIGGAAGKEGASTKELEVVMRALGTFVCDG